MPLFRLQKRKVKRIAPQEHRIKEDVIHRLLEANLSTLFGDLEFVARKPRIGGKEFDTLALNTATKVPVILEYKRERDRRVVEQVDLYYVKLKNNKADVMILLSQQGAVEDLTEVDLENPQIIVVAREFTPEQREIVSLKTGYLRLFRYQLYEDGILSLEEVEPLGAGVIRIRSGSQNDRAISGGPYTIEHFGMRHDVRKLYERLDKGITSLDSRVRTPKINKQFVGYGATGPYFCTVNPRVNSLRVHVKFANTPPTPKGIKIVKHPPGKHTSMTHYFQLSSASQLDPALNVIKGALEGSM